MSWFTTEGNLPHHVIFSKTTFVRNLFGMPFSKRLGDKNTDAFFKRADALLTKNGFHGDVITESEPLYPLSLAEKGFVDKGILTSNGRRAVYFNEPCSLSVALGGRDLITISSLLSGLAVSETANIASGAEELLDGEFEFAYKEQIGYVSSIPTLCGSGAVFSTLLFLPAIASSGEISRLRSAATKMCATIEPLFTYPDCPGDLYLLSHSPSHPCDEARSASGFSALVKSIIDREIALEGIMIENSGKIIIDKAWRAYGQLLYARRLEESDMLSLSSAIRLALAATDAKAKLPPVTIKDLNYMLGEGLNASVASASGCGSDEDVATSRAEIVSKMIYTSSGG